MLKPLPIGVDDFQEIIQKDYYYVDKTLLIKELLDKKGKVNLFTRPRRFGKTLNMSMIQSFFEITPAAGKDLFANTKIISCDEKYLSHMGKYPVIFLSLKGLKQADFHSSFYRLKEEISREFKRHDCILEHIKYKSDSEQYLRFIEKTAADEEYLASIQFLSDCLYQYYHQKVIILIDEYDVPLENAYFNGFYQEMISFIRSLFESALKTNFSLEFAVITGCLRISKESIFTGLNNLNIISVNSLSYAEYFGFTQTEIDEILSYYGLTSNRECVKKWYDGYLFGDQEVYNPWSVINYIESCIGNPHALPAPYWSNTSSNSIIRSLVEHADFSVKQEIENLIAGETITKPIHEDITYEDIHTNQDNLWNFLFFTGYLKKVSEKQDAEIRYIEMEIPNSEVRYVYKRTILQWFEESVKSKNLSELYDALLSSDPNKLEKMICENLMETISFYDHQEAFYHGFLAGLLKNIGTYIVLSNRESGNGRPDIILKYPSVRGKAVILELKVAKTYAELENKCDEALKQIEVQNYEAALQEEGYTDILKYGIAFYRKECCVKQVL